MAIGDKGYQMMQSGDIVLQSDFTRWLRDMWNWVKDTLGIKAKQGVRVEDMTLDDFTKNAVKQLTSGRKIDASGESTGSRYQAADISDTKDERLDKLRAQKPVVIGDAYKGKYELTRDSVKQWMLDNLRGKDYIIDDTGERVGITKMGVKKVTFHSMENDAYLKSVAYIPELLKRAIFIEEAPNEKGNDRFEKYRYYVVGTKIDGEDYTMRIVVGVEHNGHKYYDQYLSRIEKGSLLDYLSTNSFKTKSAEAVSSSSVAGVKDTKLLSILQNNSANTDENFSGTRFQVAPERAIEQADKVSQFIKDVLDRKHNRRVMYIGLSERANKLAERGIGHKIYSHKITEDEVRHINKEHGENGNKNGANSIPLSKDDIALLPYIMGAPDRVVKGSMKSNGAKSIRYIKELRNGEVLVVEQEGTFDDKDMEAITMWAENKKKVSPLMC
jgi:hypothetical protein